jgi:hypothetical protein
MAMKISTPIGLQAKRNNALYSEGPPFFRYSSCRDFYPRGGVFWVFPVKDESCVRLRRHSLASADGCFFIARPALG